MADLKVSQENDLGLAGIDGSVEYRVVKAGSTYKQNYDDLLTWIGSNVTPATPTLQDTIDQSRVLTNNNFYVGLISGQATSGNENIGIGTGAMSGGGSTTSCVAIGEYAGQTTNFNGIGIGYFAGQGMALSQYVTAIGRNAFRGASSLYGIAIGLNAGAYQTNLGISTSNNINIGVESGNNAKGSFGVYLGNQAGLYSYNDFNVYVGALSGAGATGDRNIALGTNTLYQNEGSDTIAMGHYAGLSNTGNNCFFAGSYAGYDIESYNNPNTGSSVIGIGYQSAGGNYQPNVIALGDYAGYLNGGLECTFIGLNAGYGNGEDNSIGIGTNALGSNNGSNAIGIGVNAGYGNQGQQCFFIGWDAGNGNVANNVIAIGRNAGSGNNLGNSFIISNEYIPTFATSTDANNYYSGNAPSSSSTYLYMDLSDNTIKCYRN